MLLTMKLGGRMPAARLRQPGRLMAAVGLCLGLAAGALLGMATYRWSKSLPEPPRLEDKAPPHGSASWLSQTSDGNWRAFARSSKSFTSRSLPAGDIAEVRWTRAERPCVEEPVEGIESWYCGAGPVVENSRRSPDSRESFVFLVDPEKDPAVETLAQALLDSGSADIVGVVRRSLFEWWSRVASFDPLRKDEQTLVLTSSSLSHSIRKSERLAWLQVASWEGMAAALRFSGRKSVREVWPHLKVLEGDPSQLWLHGLGSCRTGETIEEAGIEFVHICPGTFMMGSDTKDPRAYPDELPAHEVTLSEYWIGKYEVTDAQYREQGSDNRPVTNVSWRDADVFCRRNGWRLPTEAEWEYAARAGSRTAWSFGDDEKALGEFAWFRENSGMGLHPVGTKEPNAWGLHDMYGNAWEWVNDWGGPYKAEAQVDPNGPSTGVVHVLRGGAFGGTPRYLRSAFRIRNQPSNRFRFIGIRCARGLSPPPPLPPPSRPAGRGAPPPNK